jgi:integrase
MSKPKVKHRDLPPHMVRRTYKDARGVPVTYFYYEYPRDADGKRRLEGLGTDLLRAKMKWADIESLSATEAKVTVDEKSMAALYEKYMVWAKNRAQSKLSVRTLQDREKYWKKLEPIFGRMSVEAFRPEFMLRYFDGRPSKVSAKKEVKFLSVMFNWARARGYMMAANPVAGTTRQMKVTECRDIYVTDEMLALVYSCASPIIQDAIDLAYLTGQRPADVLKMRWDQVRDGAVWVEQGKGKVKLQINVVGELAALMDRIKSRGIVGMTLLSDPKGQKLKQSGYFRSQFDLARDKAEKRAAELGVEFVRFQFRDLRAKSASDVASMATARKLLGHSTESMTAKYVRARVGEKVSPVLKSGYDKREKS